MQTLTVDQATTIRDFFLAVIGSEHTITRLLIKAAPADRLDFQPCPGSRTMRDLIWYLVQAEDHSLNGICDGRFAQPPQPEEGDAAAALAWDAERFPNACRRLADLSGADLLRPVELNGTSMPAVHFLPVYLSMVVHSRGQLSNYLQIIASQSSVAAGQATASELSDAELDVVSAAGDFIPVTPAAGSSATIVNRPWNAAWDGAPESGQATLGSLFMTGNSTVTNIMQAFSFAALLTIGAAFGGIMLAPGLAVDAAAGAFVSAGQGAAFAGGGAAAGSSGFGIFL